MLATLVLSTLASTLVASTGACHRVDRQQAMRQAMRAPVLGPALQPDDSRGVTFDIPATAAMVRCRLGSPAQRVVISVAESRYTVLGVPILQGWREIARCAGGIRPHDTTFSLSVPVGGGDAAVRQHFQTWLVAAWDSGAPHWSQLERYAVNRAGDSLVLMFGRPLSAAADLRYSDLQQTAPVSLSIASVSIAPK